MAMDPERKADWLTRLRSGEYRQGRDALKSDGGEYCCLGVACVAAVEAGIVDEWHEFGYNLFGDSEGGYSTQEFRTDQSWSTLPVQVVQWLGVEDSDPYVTVPEDHPKIDDVYNSGYDDSRRRVSQLNDVGFTFAELADLIEDQL